MKKVFLSYSWDSTIHREWVRKLADALEEYAELHVIWDGYDLDALVDKNKFMESGISDADFVVVVATANYKAKADSRAGGVGIETYLASAAHWESLQTSGKTKVLVALREKGATPTYLAGQLYIDFSDDQKFPDAQSELLQLFSSMRRVSRPPKRRTLAADEHQYSFTKVEDLIRICHPRRRQIVGSVTGTDFSGGNRIKYELWETKNPLVGYFLALSSSSNITQTTNHAIDQLRQADINPIEITVLRPRAARGETSLISGLFAAAGFRTKVHEYTYKDYLWEFCIDDDLKSVDEPAEIPNYTDQSVKFVSEDGDDCVAPSAADHIVSLLTTPSSTCAHLVVAPGGMGKTSLCLSVAVKLHSRKDLKSTVVLIQAESIRRHVAENGAISGRIDSMFSLYEMYAKCNHFDHIFDRNTFELAFLSGNLIVIIDGLDEFVSLFPERFNLDTFLQSLENFHNELGSSAVLLTTRNSHLVDEVKLDELGILRLDLLGFDHAACQRYLSRRFRPYGEIGHAIADRVQSRIDKTLFLDPESRVVPFFADIAATVAEDGFKSGDSEEFAVIQDKTPYPSNNELTDHIIFSVMRREQIRHGLDLSVADVVHLITELIVENPKGWPRQELLERLMLLYDSRGPALAEKIALNPLLLHNGEMLELRYSFLSSYFDVIGILNGIEQVSVERTFVRSLARLSVESNEFRDVRRYFAQRVTASFACFHHLISRLRSEYQRLQGGSHPNGQLEIEQFRRAIAALLCIAAISRGGSAQHTTDLLLQLYDVERKSPETAVTVSGLFLHGEFPPIDFSNLTISDSRFGNYRNFLASKFSETKFIYCTFEHCYNPAIHSSSLSPSCFDPTCDVGDLNEFIALVKAGKHDEGKLLETEVRRFLHSFFKGDRFTDNKTEYIKFSNRVPGLSEKGFSKMVAEGFIEVKIHKEVATFYEIANGFRPSVRRLLADNYPDATMKKFFAFVRG
ncbi:toll/interleukin-1 receptor domain-containing protein [Massilia sp. TS11]|uniref:TIR domain-containing protein n=1 Tax=Massilia sp. TS11 TaxID=2908003 RepID=UPI001EDC1DB6|nr:toll/interleukin-1 receptor domain-containing protein [Massilia sp. TS11]MCG2583274.1 TIR domain-containing protein [Massilia sp. TS11]